MDNLNVIDDYLNCNINDEKCSWKTKDFQSMEEKIKYDNNETENKNYWPNVDSSIWMRSCNEEVIKPIKGNITGYIPTWLDGVLLRNGPGNLNVGEYQFNHLFDSSALLHRFHISEGKVTYQSRFVQTDVFKKNHEAQRIVVTEFGTRAVPDPCKTIFQRVSAIFNIGESMSDNSMISIYPFGDEFYTFNESPVIHRIDPNTLETKNKINISNYVAIVNHTSHPHIMTDGTVFNVGLSITSRGPAYNVIKFSPCQKIAEYGKKKSSMFDKASIVASIPARWVLNPSYMHTFGITENFFIIVEQPLAICVFTLAACQIKQEPISTCLKWHENENTLIHVISRKTGKLERSFIAESFFFLHIINQFETEDGNSIIIDISCYRDAQMLNCMYVEAMKNMQNNPDYSKLFRGRPLRFVLPMEKPNYNSLSLPYKKTIKKQSMSNNNINTSDNIFHRRSSAHRLPNGDIFIIPELICNLGCETPTLNYNRCLGRKYRYFYAISSDIDIENPGTLIKVDTEQKSKITWNENNVYPSEPIFVPSPGAQDEDDGVIVSAAVFGKTKEMDVCLLILDAKTMREIGRATFTTPGPVPKCLHGWFIPDKEIMELY
ncbi:hypothetical protein PV327_009376 [Microctonus hyperodae]|uniref:Carotenoid isomerooxygenase n=1 Tax=Microctonus hyperodae TaxID=165561 RepID=A0AA39FTN2_MICHY|nr:hypothetical protein PV327_009376 [Microctonus hyperodae]